MNMQYKNIFNAIFLIVLIFSFIDINAVDPTRAESILKQMVEKNKSVRTLQYSAIMNERIDGKMIEKKSFFKINTSPYKVFVQQSFIGINVEGLYISGMNNNQMLLCTVGFPWIQMNLDPFGSKVRNNHHHTIFEAGFNYFVDVTDKILNKYRDSLPRMLSYEGETKMFNHKCYKIVMHVNSFRYSKYTVKGNEKLPAIAKSLIINDFMIVEKNPDISDYNDVKPGQVIWIPTDYGKKFVLYVDTELGLPVYIEVFDDKGLYATYGYDKLVINATYASNEFSPTFTGYHFR
jgi:outer membrane lipoprotein-sorting protein